MSKQDQVDWANRVVEGIEDRVAPAESFSLSRWPYTYAYDYMREHNILGCHDLSRSECGGAIRKHTPKHYYDVLEIFALAYCRQYGITVPVNVPDKREPALTAVPKLQQKSA